jgi:hypothetical protein
MNNGDGCLTMSIYMFLMLLNCALKMVKIVNFMSYMCNYNKTMKKQEAQRVSAYKELLMCPLYTP